MSRPHRTPGYMDTTYMLGMPHYRGITPQVGKGKKQRTHKHGQAGSFAIAPVLAAAGAAHTFLKAVKSASRALEALEKNPHKNNILWKAARGIASVGKSIGYGPPPKKQKKRKAK